MSELLYKELRLAAHPSLYVFMTVAESQGNEVLYPHPGGQLPDPLMGVKVELLHQDLPHFHFG